MAYLDKPLDSVRESDLQALVDDGVREGRTTEYKSALPAAAHTPVRKFLAAVSSLANAAGGHLIYGIDAKDGLPRALSGLHGLTPADADAAILRLDSLIRGGIEPRIPGVGIQAVPLANTSIAIVIRLPRSWASPHVVNYDGHWRFYSRNSAGVYPLDVAEVRAAFQLSEGTSERLRRFRSDRLAKIVAGETLEVLEGVPKVVLHILPRAMFDVAATIDISWLANDSTVRLTPMYAGGGWHRRYNFDGFITYIVSDELPKAYTYLQVFNSGAMEAVDAFSLAPREGRHIIPSVGFETRLVESMRNYISIQRQLGVEPPVFVALTLLGVYGYSMGVDGSYREVSKIDRNDLVIPEVMLEDFDVDPDQFMRPLFDAVWNSAGWARSMNYDTTGKRVRS